MTKKRLSLAVVLTLLAGLLCASAVYAAGLPGADTEVEANADANANDDTNVEVRNEAWDALTEAQKNELYAAKEAVDAAQKALYDKAAAVGLIDEETAAAMKASTDENTARMKSRGQSPIFGFRIKTELSELTSADFPLMRRGGGGSLFNGDGENADGFEFDKEEWLQQAVSEGKLTQEEADRMRERFENFSEKIKERINKE